MARKGRKCEFVRYPKFYSYYLRAFEKMVQKREEERVDERRIAEGKKSMGWKTAQDVMDWWLDDAVQETQTDGQISFDL